MGAQYLELKNLKIVPRIACCLSPEIACQYHVLPVAKDGERYTVAMADPADGAACQAVRNALGSETCLVRADRMAIDHLLAELWPQVFRASMLLLAWLPESTVSESIVEYAHSFADSLGAMLQIYRTEDMSLKSCRTIASEVNKLNPLLFIFSGESPSIVKRISRGSMKRALVKCLSGSILFVDRPTWPLRNILLILWNEQTDEKAVDWTIHLARRSGAVVSVLPVGASVPPVYSGLPPQLSTALSTKCSFGRHVRSVAQRLVDWEIEATIFMRQGEASWQVHQALIERHYDLLILGASSGGWQETCLNVDLVATTLSWAGQPVLVA